MSAAMSFFDGASYEPSIDLVRLSSLLGRVKALMLDGKWRTLRAIVSQVGGSESSVSARLRDLRKPRFGNYNVERRRVVDGLFEYRVAAR